jgi:BirA family biotin operon repressor/biotin-[acetyl-CoA-carboxylase] ligase
LETVTSTQEVAHGLPIGSVVVADRQTAGRGRLGRRWQSPPGGGLAASFVVAPNPLASLAAGVAAAEACGAPVRLKWPNDLLLKGRKLGGILVEGRPGRMVIGIGINLAWAPPGGASLAADRDELLERLQDELEWWLQAGPEQVLVRWRERSDTVGRTVRVELAAESFVGVAEDIDVDGALIVSGRRVPAADVIHLRGRGRRPAEVPSPPGEIGGRDEGRGGDKRSVSADT